MLRKAVAPTASNPSDCPAAIAMHQERGTVSEARLSPDSPLRKLRGVEILEKPLSALIQRVKAIMPIADHLFEKGLLQWERNIETFVTLSQESDIS